MQRRRPGTPLYAHGWIHGRRLLAFLSPSSPLRSLNIPRGVQNIAHSNAHQSLEALSWHRLSITQVLVDFADLNNDDEIGYLELSNVLLCDDIIEFAALVPNKKKEAQAEKDNAMKIGSRGCTVAQVREAQNAITTALINRGSGDLRENNMRSVLNYLDVREDGMITRDELKAKLKLLNVIGARAVPQKRQRMSAHRTRALFHAFSMAMHS